MFEGRTGCSDELCDGGKGGIAGRGVGYSFTRGFGAYFGMDRDYLEGYEGG